MQEIGGGCTLCLGFTCRVEKIYNVFSGYKKALVRKGLS